MELFSKYSDLCETEKHRLYERYRQTDIQTDKGKTYFDNTIDVKEVKQR